MSLPETVFTLQSHAFFKCQYFFVGEPTSIPYCHLDAKCSSLSLTLSLSICFLIEISTLSAHICLDLRIVLLSDLILNHLR